MKKLLSLIGVCLLVLVCTSAFASEPTDAATKVDTHKFAKAELFAATSGGQKKSGESVKGTLFFDTANKNVDFLQESGSSAMTIKYDAIKNITYEKASKPRYAEAVLISPMFLLVHSKKHYMTFQYTDEKGEGKYAIVRLDKKNAREAVACAEAQTGKKVEQIEEK